MTPTGRVQRLDAYTEAVYLFGREGGRAPGWYVREKIDGAVGRMLGGPFDSMDEARDSSRRCVLSTPDRLGGSGTSSLPIAPTEQASPALVRSAFEAAFADAHRTLILPVGHGTGWIVDPEEFPLWFHPMLLVKASEICADPTSRVDSFVKLEGGEGLILGAHVHLASFVHILGGGRCLLEDGASMGSGAKVVTGSNVPGVGHGCSAIAQDAVVVRSFCWVKRNATLFVNAVILPGVVVGEGACVAAGAVVLANTIIPDGEIWGGCPAKRIGVVR